MTPSHDPSDEPAPGRQRSIMGPGYLPPEAAEENPPQPPPAADPPSAAEPTPPPASTSPPITTPEADLDPPVSLAQSQTAESAEIDHPEPADPEPPPPPQAPVATESADDRPLDYLPARMLNEFSYCPRLFYYEHVEGVFADNVYTVEGSLRHRTLERRAPPAKSDALPAANQIADEDTIHARSITLASDRLGLIAKLDLIEASEGQVVPVDYKRGKPRRDEQGDPEAWEPERVQLAVQALVLRENGYRCDEGVIYFSSTKQRIPVAIDHALIQRTLELLAAARATVASGSIPPPLVDSPKCPRCSLVGICLPNETHLLAEGKSPPEDGQRPLVPARDDTKPLYLNTQGIKVGKTEQVLQIRQEQKLLQEVRIQETSQVNLFGNVQISTQAVQTLCENDVPLTYFSQGGWFYGMTQGLGLKNIGIRREQFRRADDPEFCLRIARELVVGKIRNQRTLLQRNHLQPPKPILSRLRALVDEAQAADSIERLLGLEGVAARTYFQEFAGMIKLGEQHGPEAQSLKPEEMTFHFNHRNRRPPRDPVNALLSLAYSMLAKDLTIACHAVGLDPYLGFYHQLRPGRTALALDLMEPFRPLIADSVVITAINNGVFAPKDFVRAGHSVALHPTARKRFFVAYEQRINSLVTHPLFNYRVTYRRILEIQTRLLARVLTREITEYPVFTTR